MQVVPLNEFLVSFYVFCSLKEARESNMVQVKSPLGMRLLMLSPNREERIQINHPAASTNCSDVPIFRLMEMSLSQTSLQPDPVSFVPELLYSQSTSYSLR